MAGTISSMGIPKRRNIYGTKNTNPNSQNVSFCGASETVRNTMKQEYKMPCSLPVVLAVVGGIILSRLFLG